MEEVKIEEAKGVVKGGTIPWLKDKYPFGKLTPGKFVEEGGIRVIEGPSFLIPKAENPPKVMANGRKRYKMCKFVTKKVTEEGDIRVWMHPDSGLPGDGPKDTVIKPKDAAPKKKSPPKPPAKKPGGSGSAAKPAS